MQSRHVVMLGGHLCTPALWHAQCEGLGDIATCTPLELIGGDSMPALANAILEQAPPTFSLVGLSMGGHVAMEIMRRAPGRIERLALVDTRADVDSPERLKVRAADEHIVREQGFAALAQTLPGRWLGPGSAGQASLRQFVLEMVMSVGDEVRKSQLKALLGRTDSRPSLREIRCPTLVMCGRQDTPNPVWMHEEMAALIPNARLHIIEDCGHLSPIEQPPAVTQALRDWLGW